jgi:hypothetical protein
MFGIRAKLPISEEDRLWVDHGFERLSKMLGRQRMLEAHVVLPDATHFPDLYDTSEAAAEKMFCRICDYMQVDRCQIDLEVFADETAELRQLMPYWSGGTGKCAAGIYMHPEDTAKKMVVALRHSQMDDPLSVVATLAHELGHVILLGRGLIDHDAQDMEPITDLVTVFLGFGIFNANCAGRFKQWQDNRKQGWSMQRLGYLPEEVYGYALARFAHERHEHKPKWAVHLSTNVRNYFKKSADWLKNSEAMQKALIR